ncbi:MAG: serine/threonine-protein kinase [Verrucomicrobiota bacterium]
MMNAQAKELFASAYELEVEERETFLEEACGGDGELHSEVESMLEDAAKADAFFAEGNNVTISMDGSGKISGKMKLPSVGNGVSLAEKSGDVIGPYKLLEKVGEGSFGVVFIVEQFEPIKRMVALKIIKPGMDTREVIARFEIERQALALMDHPNISKVIDAGTTETGRPYFAMELVKGVPVTDYCDTHCLDTRQRLILFQDICSAVQHAHQKGIIHRDLKPSNILVIHHEARPVVKVIDFGVAKAIKQELTEKSLYTAIGQMIGTPQYMSPEQSATQGSDIDTRCDIYSLGVVLYELLTGKTPLGLKKLREAGIEEMYRLIREEEPLKPSTRLDSLSSEENTSITKVHKVAPEKLSRQIRGDLDWIVMKALEKDRSRRYETADGFAADIGHYLTDKPVTACPPSASYRMGKFARRNKAVLTTVALVIAVMVAGTVVSIWQAVRATKAEAQAESARSLAEQSAEESKAVLDFLENKVLSAARPKSLGGGLGIDATIREAIDAAAPKIGESFVGQPIIEATVRHDLGYTYSYLGDNKAAITQRERALELRKEELGSEHPDTLATMGSLAYSYSAVGEYEKALALGEETLNLKKKVLGAEHPDTLAEMAKVAIYYRNMGRFEEALDFNEKTLKLKIKVLGANHPNIIQAMGSLASSYGNVGRVEEALDLNEQTLKLKKEVLGFEHPSTLASMSSLAYSYSLAGRHEEALALKEETLELKRKVLGSEHPSTLASMSSLASSYGAAGRFEEALRLKKETMELRKKVLGLEHPDTLKSMASLADAYEKRGSHLEAQALRKKASELRGK